MITNSGLTHTSYSNKLCIVVTHMQLSIVATQYIAHTVTYHTNYTHTNNTQHRH